MQFRILLLLAALTACAPEPRVASAPDFSPDQKVAIEAAVAKWNTVLKEPIRLEGGGWKLINETPPDYSTKGWSGETVRKDKLIYIKPDEPSPVFYALVLHELGHTRGMHDTRKPGVMNGTIDVRNPATEFTEDDLEECRTVGACQLSPLDLAKCQFQGACP